MSLATDLNNIPDLALETSDAGREHRMKQMRHTELEWVRLLRLERNMKWILRIIEMEEGILQTSLVDHTMYECEGGCQDDGN